MPKVNDIMTEQVIACAPATQVSDVARILAENRFSGMPVVENDRVVGVVTEDDLLKIEKPIRIPQFLGILGSAVYLDNPLDGDEVEKQISQVLATEVREIMSKEFEVVNADLDIHQLAALMIDKNLSIVPVVNADHVLVGVVTKSDIVSLLANE
ncbi:MAG: hypothetical protein A3J48_02100 [Candidatus Doudnabacteria bacterium RIFCSPHIGHO2_02_FULL_46_11]|uniref:CBS domain-containing protein n=1 Tax=Candidatus Doudnabacteria bacterium RIFCSPHIGHO2_02_FULL_46_11 TaxID=1817832 RepID=A0A1F5P4S5_9BACT|nr:MAG: hypothetical protein A3J48_02100 [Candidatus Doudnabacteria bacterium RIFCSPHIGHO2_02_FULL_46_11]